MGQECSAAFEADLFCLTTAQVESIQTNGLDITLVDIVGNLPINFTLKISDANEIEESFVTSIPDGTDITNGYTRSISANNLATLGGLPYTITLTALSNTSGCNMFNGANAPANPVTIIQESNLEITSLNLPESACVGDVIDLGVAISGAESNYTYTLVWENENDIDTQPSTSNGNIGQDTADPSATNYTLTITEDETDCTVTDSNNITVNELPFAELNNDTICVSSLPCLLYTSDAADDW